MFAKVFQQIFDSTIAENYRHRHVFMDLLVMADVDGVVNKTVEAIARTANAPIEEVRDAIEALCLPDPDSQNKEFEGRRLVPIEDGRAWGWRIVSYAHYRAIRDQEQRRQYHRDYYTAKTKKKPKANAPAAKPKKRHKPYEELMRHPDHPGTYPIHPNSPFLDPDRLGPDEPPE